MDTAPILAALDTLAVRTPEEEADLAALRAVVAAPGAAPWDRGTPLHLTASALVVHPPSKRVLLRWHARQQAWLQVGGHADPGETDPLAIARREAVEETGLDDVRPWPDAARPALLHAVVVDVPAGKGEPAHRHGDLRYLLATDAPERARPEDAAAELRWLDLAGALALTGEANLRETIRRAAELLG